MTTPAPVILYHAADLDGKCSAAIARLALRQRDPSADPILIPMDYGWAIPGPDLIPDHSPVYILDFSLPPDDMLALCKRCSVTWIDHHTPRILELQAAGVTDHCHELSLSDHAPAACLLTWQFFNPNRAVPFAVHEINAWDATPDAGRWGAQWESVTKPFQFGLRLQQCDPGSLLWIVLLVDQGEEAEQLLESILCDGSAVLRYLDAQLSTLVPRQAYAIQLHLPRITTDQGEDESGDLIPMRALLWTQHPADPKDLLHHPDCHNAATAPDILITWAYEGASGLWRASISPGPNSPTLDCARISQIVWQGGGHPGRAGATFTKLPKELLPYPAYI